MPAVESAKAGYVQSWRSASRTGQLQRLQSPAASGTARLLEDPGLLAAKLREETEELLSAASVEEVVHEAADVLYLAMVALARGGGTLEEVRAELERRSLRVRRRPMQAKEGTPGGAP